MTTAPKVTVQAEASGSSRVGKRGSWQRYAGAVVITLLAVAGRAALDPWWGHHRNRHLVFIPTIMLAAWYGGFRAGLVSTVLSTIALYLYWSDEPIGVLHAPSSDLVIFAFLGAVVSAVIGTLQVARARADAATRSRQRVLEVVAHDLRSPLTTIRTTAEGIARTTPEVQPRLDRINRAVARMDDLIRDLVDTTRIEHGELAVHVKPEPVDPILQDASALFAAIAQEQGIALDTESAPAGTTVPCDRSRILQVLSNLIGNALKFTPSGGRIALGVHEDASAVRFTVADTGPGVAPEALPHIFEQYWRSDERGTGLGLFIADSIVRAHGGRIWVESKAGEGARFTFTLPRSR